MIGGIAVAVLTLGPGIPIHLKSLAIDPYIAIVNIMACRVYRRTKLGLIRESEISTTAIDRKRAVHAVVFKNVTVSSGVPASKALLVQSRRLRRVTWSEVRTCVQSSASIFQYPSPFPKGSFFTLRP